MLTASPERVQIIASETPLAIERASAEPRAAIASNTLSMPVTVPRSPSRGHSGTSTRSRGRLADIPALSREIIALRTWCAVQLMCSVRASQAASRRSACRGSTLLKYHQRSITIDHMIRQAAKIRVTTKPPSSTMSRKARSGASSASCMLRALQAAGQQAGALFIDDLHDRAGHRGEPGIGEQQRDGDAQAQNGGDHRLRDTRRHQL